MELSYDQQPEKEKENEKALEEKVSLHTKF